MPPDKNPSLWRSSPRACPPTHTSPSRLRQSTRSSIIACQPGEATYKPRRLASYISYMHSPLCQLLAPPILTFPAGETPSLTPYCAPSSPSEDYLNLNPPKEWGLKVC